MFLPIVAKPDMGRERTGLPSLEEGLCCHESVPLRARLVAVAFTDGRVLDVRDGGVGRGRKGSSLIGGSIMIEDGSSSFDALFEGDVGVKVTGGSIDRLESGCSAALREGEGSGPVFEGDNDLARSTTRSLSVFIYIWNRNFVPSRLACLSLRLCANSSSNLFDRSSSSPSLFSLRLTILARN